ncbi:SIS domain-containing protein [Paenibacillus oleatilyticus]|uniref:Fructosamine deglycase n=1 Tax=Paenibacillus oleatilyticus TaxID=2594886 RepID=A0ABV4VAA9_9BACL
MLNFDRQRFVGIMKGAVGLRSQIEQAVDEITKKQIDNVFLVGSGGTIAIKYPFEYIIKTHSSIPVYAEIAAELLVEGHKQLTDKSLVITSSLSGTTQETVDAAKFCREKGATVIGIVGDATTPLAQASDYVFANAAANDTLVESFHLQLLLIVLKFLNNRGEFDNYALFADQLALVPEALAAIKEKEDARAEAFAKKYKDEKYHMLVGSGNLWGWTYLYAMCVLEEMQWIHAKSIHAAEFFHGTIELVEKDMSIILFKGEDATRPLMERVERFVTQYSDEVTIFDAKDYALDGIHPEFREFLSTVTIATVMERVSAHLEVQRNHPLTTRRYYRVVKY